MSYTEDSMREMRTMVLLSLPYPPLPVLAACLDQDDGRLQDDGVTTSHTFIAKGLNESMARADHAANRERMERQRLVFQQFLHAMATEGFTCDSERLYLIYCRFTLEHIATYFPVGHPLDIRFQPLSYICKGDKTHLKLAEYLAGQSILYEDRPHVERSQYLHFEPEEMFMVARDRIGHVMSESEKAELAKEP